MVCDGGRVVTVTQKRTLTCAAFRTTDFFRPSCTFEQDNSKHVPAEEEGWLLELPVYKRWSDFEMKMIVRCLHAATLIKMCLRDYINTQTLRCLASSTVF